MALSLTSAQFDGKQLLRGNVQGTTTTKKSTGLLDGTDLKAGLKVTVSTATGDVKWEGSIMGKSGNQWKIEVKNTVNTRPVVVGAVGAAAAADPTENVTVTVTSPPETQAIATAVDVTPTP